VVLDWLAAFLVAVWLGSVPGGAGSARPPPGTDLDRMTLAVEAAESRSGADESMWRRKLDGPQGPMQVSAAAASDVGHGDRFDPQQNRQIGRAYLALLFERYGSWVDAVAAYNWGPANFERWVAAGRPASGLSAVLRTYLHRVLGQYFAAAAQASPPALPMPPAEPAPVAIRDPGLARRSRGSTDFSPLRPVRATAPTREASSRRCVALPPGRDTKNSPQFARRLRRRDRTPPRSDRSPKCWSPSCNPNAPRSSLSTGGVIRSLCRNRAFSASAHKPGMLLMLVIAWKSAIATSPTKAPMTTIAAGSITASIARVRLRNASS
jgi:hypothetical protein